MAFDVPKLWADWRFTVLCLGLYLFGCLTASAAWWLFLCRSPTMADSPQVELERDVATLKMRVELLAREVADLRDALGEIAKRLPPEK